MKIDLDAVTKKYGKDGSEKCVLDHVSLSVETGEMVAVCGKSGAGKSTLLHLIGLLDAPTSGTISFDGQNITATKSDRELSKIRNEKIGFVLQDFGLIEDESVYNNVSLPLMFGKAKLTSIDERVQDVLAKVGMDSFVE
nr:ATP-binding cassette domain-containing protein [Lachnospiraceae bacterium]